MAPTREAANQAFDRTLQRYQAKYPKAMARLRSRHSRNGFRGTSLAMVFKLLQSAKKHWKRIKGFNKLELVVNIVKFQNGELLTD